MFDTPYNREVAHKMALLNRHYARHVGDIGDGAGISGGILTGGRRHKKRGGEFELEGGNFLDILKAPFHLLGLGEDAEGAALSGGRKRVYKHKRAATKKRGGNWVDDMTSGISQGMNAVLGPIGAVAKNVAPFLPLLGLGEDAEGAALSGGRRKRVYKRRGGEDMGGILTGGRKKRGGSILSVLEAPFRMLGLGEGEEMGGRRKKRGGIVSGGEEMGSGKKSAGKKSAGKKAATQNPWISHVKKFAAKHGISYRDAMRSPACKASYH